MDRKIDWDKVNEVIDGIFCGLAVVAGCVGIGLCIYLLELNHAK